MYGKVQQTAHKKGSRTMKNRKLLLIVSLVLALTMSLGGTLAYLTDSDGDVNVMTVGRVEIKQNEQDRYGNGFQQEQMLLPIVGNKLDDGKYNVGANYIDKIVTVTNTGNTAAWVRTLIAIPDLTYDGQVANTADKEVLHWNFGAASSSSKVSTTIPGTEGTVTNQWYWSTDKEKPYVSGSFNKVAGVTIDNKPYTVFIATHKTQLASKTTTAPNLTGIYLDERVDFDNNNNYYTIDGVKIENLSASEPVKVLVLSQAVQASGFADAWTAFSEAFDNKALQPSVALLENWFADAYMKEHMDTTGDQNVPPVFPPETGIWVNDDAELAAAIEAGETTIGLNAGTFHMPNAAKDKTLTLLGSGAENTVIEVVPVGQGEANGQLDYSLEGSNVTFYDLTIKTNSQLYAGFARLSGTYNHCVIQNTYNLGTGNSVFNDCEINITNEYLRVGGANSAEFNGCVFNTEGRAILVYQDGTTVAQTVTVKDCTFNATAAAHTWNGIHVAAVSYDGSQGGTYVVNFEGNNVVDSDFNGLWQIKGGEDNVTVNGLN